jgi:hypothetical protein
MKHQYLKTYTSNFIRANADIHSHFSVHLELVVRKKVIEVAYNPIIPTHAPTLKQDHKFDSGTSISLLTPQKLFLFSKHPKLL